MNNSTYSNYSPVQLTILVLLRISIGWHFLYEGIAKLLNPYWSSVGLLEQSQGIFSGFYTLLAVNPVVLRIVDFLNIWGLILIGLALMLGFLSRAGAAAGVLLLLLYYFAAPPYVGASYSIPAEGSYLLVNKTLIECIAMALLFVFPTSHQIGLDRVIRLFMRKKSSNNNTYFNQSK